MRIIWKDIKGFEGLYQISNTGDVKSLARYKNHYSKKVYVPECIRKPGKDKNGYLIIPLNLKGKKYMRKIHRLVAEAFIPNPDNKPVVDHIDCDVTNNNVSNLRWATIKENNKYINDNGHIGRDSNGRFKGVIL